FERARIQAGLLRAPHFSVPMPFTTFVWRGVAMTPEGYAEMVATQWQPVREVQAWRDDVQARAWATGSIPAAARLSWFAHGFVAVHARRGELLISDLRMGLGAEHVFSFVVARQEGREWVPVVPEQQAGPA